LNRELSFHVVALDKLSRQEKASQHALRALADEKQVLEQKLKSRQKDIRGVGHFVVQGDGFGCGASGGLADKPRSQSGSITAL
jgi:hypothetical protein